MRQGGDGKIQRVLLEQTKLIPLSFSLQTLPGTFEYTLNNLMKMLFEERIDGYVADILFRKRHPRFRTADRHKPKKEKRSRHFTPKDFIYESGSLKDRAKIQRLTGGK